MCRTNITESDNDSMQTRVRAGKLRRRLSGSGGPAVAARGQKTDLAFDEWCKALTPSSELRKAYHGETIDFAAFSEAYREELAQHREEGQRLAALAKKQTLTLLYGAKDTQKNHARVLADWLRHLTVS